VKYEYGLMNYLERTLQFLNFSSFSYASLSVGSSGNFSGG